MAHCCSECEFTTNFESALMMHRQLYHEKDTTTAFETEKSKPTTLPTTLDSSYTSTYSVTQLKGGKIPSRSSSATRLFDKLRARLSRSKMLFSHPEETTDNTYQDSSPFETSFEVSSGCTPKMPERGELSRMNAVSPMKVGKETYICHLCPFEADRITVLDRHLLSYHKISLEDLLKLVMAKTKDGLTESPHVPTMFGHKQPYYKVTKEIMEQGEFLIETVSPKIKILKHSATNTDIKWTDMPNLNDNCRMITEELEKFMKNPTERTDKEDFLEKMQTLNECMCRFVDSSNTLKKTLTKEFGSRHSVRVSAEQSLFDLSLGDRDTPREWEKAHSEKMERNRKKRGDNNRGDKKLVAESYYF
ncbi:uncharacterized protein LOC142984350 [Anticarsia gemmatalis]|uniref:uncharacterized protein LOC142984350 n=1 Tax=Anticarsia gemmatalis TaxID=129554 RepID=UPI003F76B373